MRKLLISFFLLASSQAFGAYTLVTHGVWVAAGDVMLNTSGANLIVLAVSAWSDLGDVNAYTIGDYQGGGNNNSCYTRIAAKYNPGYRSSFLFYCLNPPHTGASHGFYGGYGAAVYITAWSGSATSAALDVVGAGAATTSSSAFPAGPMTPTCSNELVMIAWGAHSGAATSVTGATISDTVASGDANGGGSAYAIQTTATAINPSINFASPTAIAATMAGFKAADSSCGTVTAAPKRRVVTGGE